MTSDWPQLLELECASDKLQVEIDTEELTLTLRVRNHEGTHIAGVRLALDELRDFTGILNAGLSELRKVRVGRENAKLAAQALVNQVGSVAAARAALDQIEAA